MAKTQTSDAQTESEVRGRPPAPLPQLGEACGYGAGASAGLQVVPGRQQLDRCAFGEKKQIRLKKRRGGAMGMCSGAMSRMVRYEIWVWFMLFAIQACVP